MCASVRVNKCREAPYAASQTPTDAPATLHSIHCRIHSSPCSNRDTCLTRHVVCKLAPRSLRRDLPVRLAGCFPRDVLADRRGQRRALRELRPVSILLPHRGRAGKTVPLQAAVHVCLRGQHAMRLANAVCSAWQSRPPPAPAPARAESGARLRRRACLRQRLLRHGRCLGFVCLRSKRLEVLPLCRTCGPRALRHRGHGLHGVPARLALQLALALVAR